MISLLRRPFVVAKLIIRSCALLSFTGSLAEDINSVVRLTLLKSRRKSDTIIALVVRGRTMKFANSSR